MFSYEVYKSLKKFYFNQKTKIKIQNYKKKNIKSKNNKRNHKNY